MLRNVKISPQVVFCINDNGTFGQKLWENLTSNEVKPLLPSMLLDCWKTNHHSEILDLFEIMLEEISGSHQEIMELFAHSNYTRLMHQSNGYEVF